MSVNGNGRAVPWRALFEWAFRAVLALLVWIMSEQIGDVKAVRAATTDVDRRVVALESQLPGIRGDLDEIKKSIERLDDKLDRGFWERLGVRENH